MALGLAPVVTMTTDLILGTVPPERAGTASGMSETSSELGGALGIAVLGSIVTAIYRGRMADAVPADIALADAEAARATLGGALAVVEELPEHVGVALLATARGAFTEAFELTVIICAAVAIASAVMAAILLRGTRSGSGPKPEQAPDETDDGNTGVAIVSAAARDEG